MTNRIPKTSGIYKITCTVNGKIYIGSSVNLRKRWNEHQRRLFKNQHDNPHLQSAWNKYGSDTFTFEIIELVMPFSVVDRENYWLKKLKPYNRTIGFNIAHRAEGGTFGQKFSLKTRMKMSASGKRKVFSSTHKANLSKSQLGRKISRETIEKRLKKTRKDYIFINPDGNKVEVNGLIMFCSKYGLSTSAMSQVASGKRKHHKGWRSNDEKK